MQPPHEHVTFAMMNVPLRKMRLTFGTNSGALTVCGTTACTVELDRGNAAFGLTNFKIASTVSLRTAFGGGCGSGLFFGLGAI